MCPNMNFAISMVLNRAFDMPRVMETIDKLSAAHPFLNAVPGYEKESNRYFYDITSGSKVEFIRIPEEVTSVDAPEVMAELDYLNGYDWDIFHESLLKIACAKCGDKTYILMVTHHLLVDGRGLLGLAGEFADYYVSDIEPKAVSEKLITSEDLPGGSKLPFVSRVLIDKVNRAWAKENHILTYEEYHKFAMDFVQKHKAKHVVNKLSDDELNRLVDDCRENNVTVNDALVAQMMIEEKTHKVIIASDLRKKLNCYNAGALGNYSTAFGVTVSRKTSDVIEMAKAVHKEVRKKMNTPSERYLILLCYANLDHGALDASFMAAKGAFPSEAAGFIGKKFFGFENAEGYSITNLGKIENANIDTACFVPPFSPAVRKTKGVLTVNGKMIICTSEV